MSPQDESTRPAGPVSDSGLSLPGESSESSPPTGDELEEDVTALLSKAEEERDEYLDLAQRTKADFENFRKRMIAEVEAAQVRGKVSVAREVIEAVDNLERALEAAGEGESLASGVEMVLGGL